MYSESNVNFWVVRVDDGEVYGVEMKDDVIEPKVDVRQNQKVFKIVKDASCEWSVDEYRKMYYMILFNEERCARYEGVKLIREEGFPEYCVTEFMKEANEVKKMKREFDKKVLTDINDCIIKGESNKAVVLFEFLFLKKSKEIVIHMCSEYKQNELEKYLIYKLNLGNLVKEFNNEKKYIIMNDNMRSDIKGESSRKKYEEALEDAAIDLKSYQNMEGVIKSDLFNKGIIKESEEGKEEDVLEKVEVKEEDGIKMEMDANVNLFYKEKDDMKNKHDLFSDLSKLNVNNYNSSNTSLNNSNLQRSANKISQKRKHKELINAELPFGQLGKDKKKKK